MTHRPRFVTVDIRLLSAVVCLAVAVAGISGCAPLRKKFVRKKKEDSNAEAKFVPVLNPIEYPTRQESPEEAYKYHYSLWKVWNRDLLETVENDGSDKRERYLINQSLEQLQAMHDLLNDESKAQMAGLMDELSDVLKEYDKPESFRSKFSMRSKIQRYARKVREQFTPNLIFGN